MSDTLSRVKNQLRPVNGSVLNGNGIGNGEDKSPSSPGTKLLINHGKPNYTIQRSPKAQQNGATNPLNNELQNNNRNNYYPYKSAGVKGTTGVITNGNGVTNNNNNSSSNSSQNGDELIIQSTKFNGVFKAANIQKLENNDEADSPVVLRRVPKPESTPAAAENGNDENVPEFILRQRRIQERLAKENILDFENRRSGYFTHVVISPTSPNRTSLVETMSSPPIVPSLEIPPPAKESREASIAEENNAEVSAANGVEHVHEEEHVAVATNGQVEEEEVAKAIEEVNKAVAGEVDDEKPEELAVENPVAVEAEVEAPEQFVVEHKEEEQNSVQQEETKVEAVQVEEQKVEEVQTPVVSVVVTSAPLVDAEEPKAAEETVHSAVESHEVAEVAEHVETVTVTTNSVEEPKESGNGVVAEEISNQVEAPKENGEAVVAETLTNGHAAEDVIISHTNGVSNGVTNGQAAPSLPTPDPSGALGVNYEPKTVVSFSKDLDAPNKYPDTVKVTKTDEQDGKKKAESDPVSDELKELAKLKFDIKADDNDVQVTPVLRVE